MNKSIFSETELLRQLAKDNKEAFKILFDQYYPVLVRVLMRYSADQDEIKDWVQEIYIKLWRSRHEIGPAENFKARFMVTARNFAINALADKRKVKLSWQMKTQGFLQDEIVNNSYTASEENELGRAYRAAILSLPNKSSARSGLNTRIVVSFRNIAAEFGNSVRVVNAQILRITMLLRQELHVLLQ